jgi:integral membrane protein
MLIRRLRLACCVEASTLLILILVAVPLKHAFGYAIATRIMGPVHGAAFVA